MTNENREPQEHDVELSTEDMQSLLSYDPFEGSEGQAAAGGEPEVEAETPADGSPPQAAPQPADGGGAPSEPVQTQEQPTTDADAWRRVAETLLTQQQGQGQQPQGQQPQGDPLPDYNWNVPEALVTAMGSEDPAERRMALQALIRGVATGIHAQVRQEYMSRLQGMATEVPRVMQQQLRQQHEQQQIYQDFYGTYPQLADPRIRPLVMQVAQEEIQRNPNVTWNAEFRDRVAKQTMGLLQQYAQGAGAKTPPPAAPPRSVPTGARPNGSAAVRDEQQAQLDDLLFGG